MVHRFYGEVNHVVKKVYRRETKCMLMCNLSYRGWFFHIPAENYDGCYIGRVCSNVDWSKQTKSRINAEAVQMQIRSTRSLFPESVYDEYSYIHIWLYSCKFTQLFAYNVSCWLLNFAGHMHVYIKYVFTATKEFFKILWTIRSYSCSQLQFILLKDHCMLIY